ncbi:hypothetical protein A7D00_4550 [Trichophyton violaceum]|uniref:Uncharacterized protein n=1 Tax=Trichophyton violaceum TaxID=34388 RepID=A0A178FI97_TRIVO|nr:hypothetical protein A7D00_4550 [Trichophyton violaceum]
MASTRNGPGAAGSNSEKPDKAKGDKQQPGGDQQATGGDQQPAGSKQDAAGGGSANGGEAAPPPPPPPAPKKKVPGVTKKICDCADHEAMRYYVSGDLKIYSCANKCPFCNYEPSSGQNCGAVIRKHIKNIHIGIAGKKQPRNVIYKNLNVLAGERGRYPHKAELLDDEEQEAEPSSSKAPPQPLSPNKRCASCARKRSSCPNPKNPKCSKK